MKVYAPHICDARTIYSIFGQVFDEQGNLRSDRYLIDLQLVAESDATGNAALATLVRWLGRQSIFTEIMYPSPARGGLQHLRLALNQNASTESESTQQTSGDMLLNVLNPEAAADWIAEKLIPWMGQELYVSSGIAISRTRRLKELLVNAGHHSCCRHIVTSAQCYREEQELVCVISDDGMGIPQAVRRVWKESINDTVAIARSIEIGFSSLETEEHEGKGLSRLVEHVVAYCNGRVSIHSGFGIVHCRLGVGNIVTRLIEADAFFPGTMFVVTFPGSSLGNIAFLNEPAAQPGYFQESQ